MALLRIRKPDGEIVEIASLPGAKGDDGKTPVKGVDYFTVEEQEAFVNAAKDYTDEKTAPATTGTYGVVKVVDDEDTAYFSGVMHSADGYLRILPATEAEIISRYGQCKPIVPANLECAVKSVGDGYYAKVEELGDIEAALDGILALQAALIGGDSV